MANLVVHFEIHASEPERLIDFYSKLFGWKFAKFGEIDYWSIDTGEGAVAQGTTPGLGINGGLVKRMGPKPPVGAEVNGCNIVIGVEGIDALFATGLELGATEALPLDDMQGIGRLGYLLDPDNNVFGMISPELSDGTNVMMPMSPS